LPTSTISHNASLVIANTGPVITTTSRDELFQPFRRLHDRIGRDGFGLGLAIVSSIVKVHHGSVSADPRAEGGLTVTVQVPLLEATSGH
jgi:signal transduction histidine kinase